MHGLCRGRVWGFHTPILRAVVFFSFLRLPWAPDLWNKYNMLRLAPWWDCEVARPDILPETGKRLLGLKALSHFRKYLSVGASQNGQVPSLTHTLIIRPIKGSTSGKSESGSSSSNLLFGKLIIYFVTNLLYFLVFCHNRYCWSSLVKPKRLCLH